MRYNLGSYIVPEECFGGTLVDIGMNNGCFTRQYKDSFSKIHGYEANPRLVEKLREEFDIDIFNEIVWSENDLIKTLAMYEHNDEDGSFGVVRENSPWKQERALFDVKTVSLERILERAGPIDYLKMDCESSEYEILKDKDLTKIRFLGLEIHNQMGKEKYEELYNFICKTHKPNQICNFRDGYHQEILFSL